MDTKRKGLIAEMKVAARLIETGWQVLFPQDPSGRYDLVAERAGRFCRVQVKYVSVRKGRLSINCRSSNNWSVKPYTPEEIDIIAAYDPNSEEIYFLSAKSLNKNSITLRLTDTGNRQRLGIRYARDHKSLEDALQPDAGQKDGDKVISSGR